MPLLGPTAVRSEYDRAEAGLSENTSRPLRIKMVEEIRWMQKHVRGEDWSPAERAK